MKRPPLLWLLPWKLDAVPCADHTPASTAPPLLPPLTSGPDCEGSLETAATPECARSPLLSTLAQWTPHRLPLKLLTSNWVLVITVRIGGTQNEGPSPDFSEGWRSRFSRFYLRLLGLIKMKILSRYYRCSEVLLKQRAWLTCTAVNSRPLSELPTWCCHRLPAHRLLVLLRKPLRSGLRTSRVSVPSTVINTDICAHVPPSPLLPSYRRPHREHTEGNLWICRTDMLIRTVSSGCSGTEEGKATTPSAHGPLGGWLWYWTDMGQPVSWLPTPSWFSMGRGTVRGQPCHSWGTCPHWEGGQENGCPPSLHSPPWWSQPLHLQQY